MHLKKKIAVLFVVLGALATTSACGYAGVASVGTDKVVVLRNDGFLFGALRNVYVCQVTDAGLTSCKSKESP